MNKLTRRRFLEDSMLATAAALASSAPVLAEESGSGSPGEVLRVAVLGCGIRGKQHANDLHDVPGCEITYVCDADEDRVGELASAVKEKQGRAPKAVQDMRRIFDDTSVDAVFVATPDHWHALAAVWAMQAGKDVYVEKPVSHNITEGRMVVDTSRKLGRICQAGTQYRSYGANAAAVNYIHDGKLGDVTFARSIAYARRNSIGGPGHYEVPAAVDYDLFAGPAPMSPLTRPTFHYDWHWFWETGSGELGNLNIHSLDVCRWGLGLTGMGRSVISYGGRLGFGDAGQTPNTQVVHFDFGDKTMISETRDLPSEPFRADYKEGWIFEGTNGFIAGTSLFDLNGNLISSFSGETESHFANFLKAVRSRRREDLNADILEGHQSTALCHAGNISWRLGQPASLRECREQLSQLKNPEQALETFERVVQHLRENEIDPEQTQLTLGPLLNIAPDREAFVDHSDADALLSRDYRAPFVMPTFA